ncbi:MAG: DUF1292 domain-containing protein [Christensenellaceae bacterium]|jgi:uncharacterized protein YrzB (UPF0473 family)|nr:DUF1292 domain-containing protein [Christensenellaceae bacterium]
MSDDRLNIDEFEDDDEFEDILTFTDAEGNDVDFNIILPFEHKGKNYLALAEATSETREEDDILEIMFAEIEYSGDVETVTVVEDDTLIDELDKTFADRITEIYDEDDECDCGHHSCDDPNCKH